MLLRRFEVEVYRLALILTGLVAFSSAPSYGDYPDCILENMKGVSSDVAAKAIERACEERSRVEKVPALEAVKPGSDDSSTEDADVDHNLEPIRQSTARKNHEAVVNGFCPIEDRVWSTEPQHGAKPAGKKNKNVISCKSRPLSLKVLCRRYEERAISRKSKFVTVRFDINQRRTRETSFWIVASAKGNASARAICKDLYMDSTRLRVPN